MEKILEEDVLGVLREYLIDNDYVVLSCNGVQGQYYYKIPGGRKFPDIIAEKNNILLIGEGKIKAPDLFKNKGNISDYDSILYLKKNPSVLQQFVSVIEQRLQMLNISIQGSLIVQFVFCANSFASVINNIEKDILLYEIDVNKRAVEVLKGKK